MWRALGDTRPAGGTKARQKHIEAMRAKAWAFASEEDRESLAGGAGHGGSKQRGAGVVGVTEGKGRGPKRP